MDIHETQDWYILRHIVEKKSGVIIYFTFRWMTCGLHAPIQIESKLH